MAFEPLETDEKLETPVKHQADMDTQMLGGCTFFVAVSFLTYFVAVWPFIVFGDLHTLPGLLRASLFGLLPSCLFGVYAMLRGGLPAATGFVGGSLAVAIFGYLRLDQLALGYQLREIAKPEFPLPWVWQAPLGYLLLTVAITLAMTPKVFDPPSRDGE